MNLTSYVRTLLAFTALTIGGHAATITGVVTNKTTNKPSGGDVVTLIRLAQGMQEATHAKTDARGHYSLDVSDDGIHLVRVTHQGANYFQPATPGTETVDIDVYDVAAKVTGVNEEADVLRIQTDSSGNTLSIVENFFLKNESTPPRTQFGDRPFEFRLPEGAVIDGSVAEAPQPEGSPIPPMPVQVAPTPLSEKGHYAFVFPIRPGGLTRFQITYHLQYNGNLKLLPLALQTIAHFAVMLPKSMSFKAGSAYDVVTDPQMSANAQTYAAENISPGQGEVFTVSGTGTLPRDIDGGAQSAQTGGEQAQTSGAPDMRPGGGLGTPIDPDATHDPWSKYKGWIIAGLVLLLAAGVGFMVQKPVQKPAQAASTATQAVAGTPVTVSAQGQRAVLLSVLKEELFALEMEHVEGKLSEENYREQKAALETVLRRALSRG